MCLNRAVKWIRLRADHPSAQRWLLSPPFATAITFLLLFTGGLGSIFSVEIRRSFPLYWGVFDGVPFTPISWEAFLFWVMALVTSSAFFFRQRAGDKSRRDAQDSLLRHAGRLEELVRTLPPENFLGMFSKFYVAAENLVSSLTHPPHGAVERESHEIAIRSVLQMVGALAQCFDGNHPEKRYAANIMVFRGSETIPQEERRAVTDRLRFCDEGIGLDGLRGVLDLDTALSTTSGEGSDPDDDLVPLALPVPRQVKNADGKWRVLPGAPHSLVTKCPSGNVDTHQIDQWCTMHGDFTQSIRSALAGYFREANYMRSFVSLPLCTLAQLAGDATDDVECPEPNYPIGVVNIHCSESGMLRSVAECDGNRPLLYFHAIATPFVIHLVKLLTQLAEGD